MPSHSRDESCDQLQIHLCQAAEMGDDVEHLVITGVELTGYELGRGAYGKVFTAKYNGVTCAVKESHSAVLEGMTTAERHALNEGFMQECRQHSKLHHPNIVKFLGVYYPRGSAFNLPVLVMELMECNLTQLLHQNISMYVKLSIVLDVCRGVHYLHTLNPPMMHRDLSSDNILLTTCLVAKVADFKTMKMAPLLSSDKLTQGPGTSDFMPPEVYGDNPHYGLSLDVFSFGCVICHVMTQQSPEPSAATAPDPLVRKRVSLSEAQRRRHYVDEISDGSLKQLVIACLDNDQERRPTMSVVRERITSVIAS